MAKKSLLVLVLALVLAAGILAQGTSVFSFGGGVFADFGIGAGSVTHNIAALDIEGNYSMRDCGLGFGGWIFADAKFVELPFGLLGGLLWIINKYWLSATRGGMSGVPDTYDNTYAGSFFALNISLLLKYPFSLAGGAISLFPLLGIGYQVVTSATLEDFDVDTPSDLNVFKIMLGVGSDLALTEALYLRVSLLGYYRFDSQQEKNFENNNG